MNNETHTKDTISPGDRVMARFGHVTRPVIWHTGTLVSHTCIEWDCGQTWNYFDSNIHRVKKLSEDYAYINCDKLDHR